MLSQLPFDPWNPQSLIINYHEKRMLSKTKVFSPPLSEEEIADVKKALKSKGKIYMTSGVAFVFDGIHEEYLLKRHRVLAGKIDSPFDGVKRFVAFHELNRKYGIDVVYADLKSS